MSHHWHILATTPDRGVISAIRYDNAPKSIETYVSLVFEVFKDAVSENDRSQYMNGMLKMSEEELSYHVYSSTSRLNLSWTDCIDEPCAFAIYN